MRGAIVAGGALGAMAILLGGCSTPPNHMARIFMQGGETMALKVDGRQPTVQLVPTFAPLVNVRWMRPDGGVTTFHGVPPGGDLVLTLKEGDQLQFSDQGGSDVEIRMWNSSGYVIENVVSSTIVASDKTAR